jgi:hypothetical protein
MNKQIEKLTGKPCNASDGCMNNSRVSNSKGDLGMGKFNPRSGANKNGNYIVNGVGGKKG